MIKAIRSLSRGAAVFAVFCGTTSLFGSLTFTMAEIGDLGNPDSDEGKGAVSYNYFIGATEVTTSQYAAFLNAVGATDTNSLYNASMSAAMITRSGSSGSYTYAVVEGMENRPIGYVSFYDAARFANWLMNGQLTGAQDATTTEDGFYTFSGATTLTAIATHSASQINGLDWVAVASEDEWYKAAFYSGSGGTYYTYGTGSNTKPSGVAPPGDADSANWRENVGSPNAVQDVGSYVNATSHYGTFDQAGNLSEWTDIGVLATTTVRDVAYDSNAMAGRTFDFYTNMPNGTELEQWGFRISSLQAVPEASDFALGLGITALAFVLFTRKRKKRAHFAA